MLNAHAVNKVMNEWFDANEDIPWDSKDSAPCSWSWLGDESSDTIFDVPRLGKVRVVEQFGGEGLGDQAWIVIGLTMCHDVERLFRKEGWHASHDGTYYDGDLVEVSARVVEKTVFEAVSYR